MAQNVQHKVKLIYSYLATSNNVLCKFFALIDYSVRETTTLLRNNLAEYTHVFLSGFLL